MHAIKLALNESIRASDDEQGINKLRPKVNNKDTRGGAVIAEREEERGLAKKGLL